MRKLRKYSGKGDLSGKLKTFKDLKYHSLFNMEYMFYYQKFLNRTVLILATV